MTALKIERAGNAGFCASVVTISAKAMARLKN
jgi:hypothetical protein